MNILIPYHWLLEHLDTKASPDQIREYASLCGPSIERIETIEGEPVFDIEVTTNRVDMMSVRGIARELSAILPEFDTAATLKPLPDNQKIASSLPDLDVKIVNDPTLSKRIMAVKLSVPKVSPSPKWLQKRLLQIGQRPLNAIIDITNYIMWELGHPTHVFDYDKLAKKTIIIRQAKPDEKITTLDHKTHRLIGGEVVFDDGTGTIIDLPGIMGTANSVVDDSTKNILFFIDSIIPEKIRFAAMTHNIRSQAAILNEKAVDPHHAHAALHQGIRLYRQITDAQIESQILDLYPHPASPKPIKLTAAKLSTYLGIEIPNERVIRILQNLGCQVATPSKDIYLVTPPTDRQSDLTIYQDVIEEIARIYGYHNLESSLLSTEIPDHPPAENFDLELRLKTMLSGWGAHEVYTNTMVSKSIAVKSGYTANEHLAIKNPLTDDMVYLRRSLIPSLLEVFTDNQGQKITVFELQNVIHPAAKSTQLPTESLELAIVSNQGYPHLKGLLDALTIKLYLGKCTFTPLSKPPYGGLENPTATIRAKGKIIGHIGETIHKKIFAVNLTLSSLQAIAASHPQYLPTYSTPPIIEDLTFAFDPHQAIGPVIDHIENADSLIEAVKISGTYQNPDNHLTHYTFTITYRHPNETLTDSQLNPIRHKIVKTLNQSFHSDLVGQLS